MCVCSRYAFFRRYYQVSDIPFQNRRLTVTLVRSTWRPSILSTRLLARSFLFVADVTGRCAAGTEVWQTGRAERTAVAAMRDVF